MTPSTLPEAALETLRRALDRAAVSDGTGTRLLLVRHGENVPRGGGEHFDGDPPLSAAGRRQAVRLAERLEEEGVDELYASPLERTLGTARIVGEHLGRSPRPLEAFREIGYAEPDGPPDPEAFGRTGRWDELEGFESDGTLRRRVREAADRLVRQHEGSRLVVVTHMMPLNALLADRLGADRSFFFRPAPASMTELRLEGERCFLVRLDDTCHLGDGGHEA